ncbi:MAG: 3-hydroxyacyl-CoA dehydrogenase NAD-binding domain-containing protein [Steroidobacteraceae bacterium]|jgi:3-hydroxyacyl-CoA dehydrogenase|nr:3-hydroxyacyl-CoA dehydrogenase NAD-binding domain-containing protein [Steroidobacteraceae bacterium]
MTAAPGTGARTPVHYRVADGIAVLEIDHPPVNALAAPVRAALLAAVERADGDPAVRAIVIAGRGAAFVAGADIREFDAPPREPRLPDLLARIEASAKPVVASVHGHALGGGLELALACHHRCATPRAKLGLPEVKLGLLPGAGGTQRLPRLVDPALALEMMLGGEPIDAARAHEAGLVDTLLPDEDALAGGLAAARALLAAGRAPRRTAGLPQPAALGPAATDAALARHARALRGLESGPHIVEALQAAATEPFAAGVARARRRFEECAASPGSRALRHLFFAERATGRSDATPRPVERVAVVGAGTMGTGIAIALADAGLDIIVIDVDAAALAGGRERFTAHYASQLARGRLGAAEAAARQARTRFAGELAAAAGCDLAIEAVFESLEVKRQVFAALDGVLPAHAVLATNTSYLDVDRIAAATRRPQAVLGLHFFSPANVMKLVEVVRGADTLPEVLATGCALARRLRKLPVIVGNATGFVGNRMLQAYGRESQLLLLEGATPAQVDRALEAFGMAMGPCAVYDLAGLDVGYRARRERSDLPDDPRYFAVADRLVEAGRLGRKSGAGHYRYDAEGRRHADPLAGEIIAAEAARLGVARGTVDDATIVGRCIGALVAAGRAVLESGIAASAADIDVVWTSGYGFPRWRGGPMHYAAQH